MQIIMSNVNNPQQLWFTKLMVINYLCLVIMFWKLETFFGFVLALGRPRSPRVELSEPKQIKV